jgi:hypothetical protein
MDDLCTLRSIFRRLMAITWLLLAVQLQCPSQIILPQSRQQKSFPQEFSYSKTSFPTVSNGFLVSFSRTIEKQDPRKGIFITALNSGQRQGIPFWIDGASVIHLDSVAISSDAFLYVGGSYLIGASDDDRNNFVRGGINDLKQTNFIAKVDQSGAILFVKNLGDYTPEKICTTPDGNLWSFGQSMEKERTKIGQQQEYLMLRRFSSDGDLISSYLKRSSVEGKVSTNYRAKTGGAGAAFIVCGGSTVGAFLQGPGSLMWTKVDIKSGDVAQVKVRNPPGTVPTGVTIVDNGDVYASFRTVVVSPGSPPQYMAPLGIFRISRDKQPRWDSVSSADASTHYSALLGHDGSYLVHFEGDKEAVEVPIIYWTKAAD